MIMIKPDKHTKLVAEIVELRRRLGLALWDDASLTEIQREIDRLEQKIRYMGRSAQ